MPIKKKSWNNVSIHHKVMVWITVILLAMLSSTGISILIGQQMSQEFDLLLEDNVACYDVQEAIKEEKRTFEVFVRESSLENWNNYENACAEAQRSIAALPFDYEKLGEERYARTWNLVHGYEGYVPFRDAFIQQNAAQENRVDDMYRIIKMQDYLSDYALRLTQVTLEQSNNAYGTKASMFEILPWLCGTLFAIAVILVLAIMNTLSSTVVQPLIRMAQESRKITENDFSGADLAVESSDEVGELTHAFNRMKHAMAEHIATLEALHQQELEKLELEKNLDLTRLEVLKSQVNPHFLFNTLNMISCMARLEEADTTDRMIVSLGNLFRYNLRTKDQEVYLEQELEALDDYIYIQQMRFDSRIVFNKIIHVDIHNVKLPSFTLQPVVENAFTHGLKNREEGGRILLRIWQEGNQLIISIVDNGKGMSEEELSTLSQTILDSETTGKHIGLGNIRRRISMLYPDGSMHIYSREGCGTAIQFIIPQTAESEGGTL